MTQANNKTVDTCPVCGGTTRQNAPNVAWKTVIFGYDAMTDTIPCRNCGGQYQSLKPAGTVKLNKENVPCTHEYSSIGIGKCITKYVCSQCDDVYTIDSGD